MDKPKRIFSEKEAADLVLRAAKLKEETPEYVAGLTYDELTKMALELGVEEQYLTQALSERERGGGARREESRGFFGFEFNRSFDAVVEGEIPPENFDVVLGSLASQQPVRGVGMGRVMRRRRAQLNPVQIGRSLKGGMQEGIGSATFEMSSRNGRTKLSATSSAILPMVAIGNPILVFSLVGSMIMTNELGLPAWAACAMMMPGLVVAALVVCLVTHRGHEQMEKKFREIVGLVENEVAAIGESEVGRNRLSDEVTSDSEVRLDLGRGQER